MVSLLVTWLGCQKFIKTGHTRTYHSRCDVFFCWTNVCWLIPQKTMTFSSYTSFLPCGRGFECKGHRLQCPEANALIIHCTLTCTFFHHPLGFAALIIINLSYGWVQKTKKIFSIREDWISMHAGFGAFLTPLPPCTQNDVIVTT